MARFKDIINEHPTPPMASHKNLTPGTATMKVFIFTVSPGTLVTLHMSTGRAFRMP
ncbi:hypothetical protein AAP_02576 [Ascosphaera apis ARSEF 7405]|uniref:Uncharacterized protein n=1 Tax=Ascosphaera apis ARSEF 7405 TaxID=392613 RepID=A0A166NXW0_9EURO|nr:hypothetical protein AAP_02576 [Ascosphaera apis ARSEF 7405]